MILKILSCKNKPFKSDEGEDIDYFWVRAEKPDGFVLQFGTTKNYEDKIGEKLEIVLEEVARVNGKGYKEVKLD